MAILKDLAGGDIVKSMSLIETAGAGAIGGLVNGIATTALPNVNPWILAGGEIVAGAVAGNVIGGKFGDMVQSGMVITGMAKVSEALVGIAKGMIGGQAQASTTGTSGNVMY